MVHIVVTLIVIVGRPYALRIGFVRIDVHHPAKQMRIKYAAGGFAIFFGGDRTQ
jgi:hypothetical protein